MLFFGQFLCTFEFWYIKNELLWKFLLNMDVITFKWSFVINKTSFYLSCTWILNHKTLPKIFPLLHQYFTSQLFILFDGNGFNEFNEIGRISRTSNSYANKIAIKTSNSSLNWCYCRKLWEDESLITTSQQFWYIKWFFVLLPQMFFFVNSLRHELMCEFIFINAFWCFNECAR